MQVPVLQMQPTGRMTVLPSQPSGYQAGFQSAEPDTQLQEMPQDVSSPAPYINSNACFSGIRMNVLARATRSAS